MTTAAGPRPPRGPWFRERPRLALSVAAVLFAAVLCLRLLAGGPADAYSLLYVFPVALVATATGARTGVAAGLLAVALTVFWAVVRDVSLSPAAWASRAFPMLLLGFLVGDASERLRRTEAERRRLESAAQVHREAVEINDTLVQGMVAAKWSLEAGQLDAGLRILSETISRGHELVSSLIRQADMGERAERLSHGSADGA